MITLSGKPALRDAALLRRSEVPDDRRAALDRAIVASGLDVARGFAHDGSAVVSAFLPIRGEPDTRPLLAALAAAGFDTALPATPPRGEPLRFHAWRPGDALVPGRFGTVEPGAEAPEVDPDVLFVPLAAFDRHGFRLGYGAGYYDGALRRLRAAKRVLAVGVAFAVQEVDAVPTEPHDERLDLLVSDAGLLRFGP